MADSPNPHIAYLDGIRGVAALYVVAHHAWGQQFGFFARRGVIGWVSNGLLYGHLAVDVFIVLSGFCLALPLARKEGVVPDAGTFFARRARRILPPFYAALLLSLGVVALTGSLTHTPGALTGKNIALNALLLQDIISSANVINGPFWSVALEWKIYFLFPALIYLIGRIGPQAALTALGVIVGAMTAAILHFRPGAQLFHSCPWYLLLFAMGAVSALLAASPSRTTVSGAVKANSRSRGAALCVLFGFLSLLALSFVYAPGGEGVLRNIRYAPLIDTLAGGFTASLLFVGMRDFAANRRSVGIAFFSWRPLVVVGLFAYSLYLIHFPLLELCKGILERTPGLSSAARLTIYYGVGLPGVIGAAYLFFLCFERPFLRVRPQKGAFSTTVSPLRQGASE